MIRPGSQGYIDENVASLSRLDIGSASDVSHASGSSVEEESDDDVASDQAKPPPDVTGRLEDFAHLDERQRALDQPELDSEESDWDVDDEDWELANGGESTTMAAS